MIRDKNLLLVPQYINGEGNITLFHSDGLSHTYLYNKYGTVNFVLKCLACQNIYKLIYFCLQRLFYPCYFGDRGILYHPCV